MKGDICNQSERKTILFFNLEIWIFVFEMISLPLVSDESILSVVIQILLIDLVNTSNLESMVQDQYSLLKQRKGLFLWKRHEIRRFHVGFTPYMYLLMIILFAAPRMYWHNPINGHFPCINLQYWSTEVVVYCVPMSPILKVNDFDTFRHSFSENKSQRKP